MVAGMAVVLAAALITGVGDGGSSGSSGGSDSGVSGVGGAGYWMRAEARFAPPGAFVPSAAITYDMDLVPAASRIEVRQHTEELGATTVSLRVTGVRAGHAYGVHVHQKPCGAAPGDAGGHYQHRPGTGADAVTAENEVRLDFTADAQGRGEASVRHSWGFRSGEAASVVVHDAPGSSGARVACFTVPFGWAVGSA